MRSRHVLEDGFVRRDRAGRIQVLLRNGRSIDSNPPPEIAGALVACEGRIAGATCLVEQQPLQTSPRRNPQQKTGDSFVAFHRLRTRRPSFLMRSDSVIGDDNFLMKKASLPAFLGILGQNQRGHS